MLQPAQNPLQTTESGSPYQELSDTCDKAVDEVSDIDLENSDQTGDKTTDESIESTIGNGSAWDLISEAYAIIGEMAPVESDSE